MLKLFKKHFIPHEGNDHQPHFLRMKNIRLLIVIIFIMQLGLLAIPYLPALDFKNSNYLASVLPAVLDDLTNQNRQNQQMAVLTINPLLNKVAELKAKDMAEKGYFAHTSPEGKAPWYWFGLVGYKYTYAGENLAVDFTDSQDVAKAWMNSPTHKANIMKNAYTEMGTGVAVGTFQGHSTIFVAQVFGKPANSEITNASIYNIVKKTSEPKEASTSKVMGASVEAINNTKAPEKKVEKLSEPIVSQPVVDTKLSQIYTKANFFQKFATSPRHIVNIVFIILGILVALALMFKFFIRMDKRHPVLITNGLIVLLLIFGAYTVNNYIVKTKLATTTSFVSFQSN